MDKWTEVFKDTVLTGTIVDRLASLSEYVVSKLLKNSSLNHDEYIDYSLDQVKYKNIFLNVCKSDNFLNSGDNIITIARLLNTYDSNFNDICDSLVSVKEKAKYLIDAVIALT